MQSTGRLLPCGAALAALAAGPRGVSAGSGGRKLKLSRTELEREPVELVTNIAKFSQLQRWLLLLGPAPCLKVQTCSFTLKNLIRHYAKQAYKHCKAEGRGKDLLNQTLVAETLEGAFSLIVKPSRTFVPSSTGYWLDVARQTPDTGARPPPRPLASWSADKGTIRSPGQGTCEPCELCSSRKQQAMTVEKVGDGHIMPTS